MALNAVNPQTIIDSHNAGKGPVLQIQVPADLSKVKGYKGAKFLNLKLTAHSYESRPINIIMAGSEEPLNIPISFGAPTPESSLSGPDATKTTVCTTLSQSGDLGRALEVLEQEYLAQLANPDTIAKLWTKKTPPHISSHIKRAYGDQARDQTKVGQPIADPRVVLTFDFGNFPDKFNPTLAGKPRSTVYDWKTRAIGADGKETFQERVDATGQRARMANASQLLPSGDIIRRIALMVDSATVHKDGVGMHVTIYKIWTERPTTEMNYLPAIKASSSSASSSASTAAPAAPIAAPVAAAAPKSNDEGIIQDM